MEKRFHYAVLALSCCTALIAGGCGKKDGQSASGDVLVDINGKRITMEDFRKEEAKLPEYIKATLVDEEGRKKFLDNLVTRELVLQKSQKMGFDKDRSVMDRLEDVKKQLMMEALLKTEIEDKAVFTEKDAEEYYNTHKDEFKVGEQVKISHIMVKTEAEAKDVLKKLQGGENFEKLAKKVSVAATASKGGEIGFLERGAVVPEFENAAFALKKVGDISPVVAVEGGFHIIKLLGRKDAETKSFADVKARILEAQTKKKQRSVFDQYVETLKKESKITINEGMLKDTAKEDKTAPKVGEVVTPQAPAAEK